MLFPSSAKFTGARFYLFLRRKGIKQHDAQDLAQGFFGDLIQSQTYKHADQSKGRFRSFLLGALKHFMANAQDRERALKRGGGSIPPVELDEAAILNAETHVARTERWDPARVYDREWAEAVLRQTHHRLEEEWTIAGKATLFGALKSRLSMGEEEIVEYDKLSARLQRPAATLRKDAERLRVHYGEILREEVRGTVNETGEVDEELRYLRAALSFR